MAKKSFYLFIVCGLLFSILPLKTAQTQTLSGRVYEGTTGTEPPTAKAIPNVTVILYGTNTDNEDPTVTGSIIQQTTTDSQGWYSLQVRGAYDYYNIVETNPSTYTSNGATSVSGTVKSADWIQYDWTALGKTLTGNKFWDKKPVQNTPPIADANGPYNGTVNHAVQFDGSGSYDPDTGDSIAKYEWDMDNDGQYDDATGANPTWTWNSPITTSIGLRVTDTHGATDTDNSTVTIQAEQSPCDAAFDADPREGCAPLTVNFTDKSSNAQSWFWKFTGGNPSTSTQQNPTVTYQNPGSYGVYLRITCASGAVDSVYVANFIVADYCPQDCEAAFNADPREGCAPLTVNFTDKSSNAQSWFWKFTGGNPSSSTKQNPTVIYQNSGSYSVKLKIICQDGQVDSVYANDYITVRDCGQGMDFGDAPDPKYPTLLASNGARHKIDPAVYLGAKIDADSEGQQNSDATGDDNDGTDDEDGVVFKNALVPGSYTSFVATASVHGNLGVWVDFNGNGSWADPGESIFNTDTTVYAGANHWGFKVPNTAKLGKTFARFRYSTKYRLTYNGEWPDGEVEDYQVEIINDTDLGTITIRKNATPADNTPFNFTSDFGPFLLKYPSDSTITFSGVKPGTYDFSEILPSGWKLKKIEWTDPSGGTTTDFTTATATVRVDGNEHILVTFYNQKEGDAASIGDRVWNDLNHNGLQDAGEAGIANVTVTLYDPNGSSITSTMTNSNGNYEFSSLPAGMYKVGFTLLAGYIFSPADQGADDAIDSDANPSTGLTALMTLLTGEQNRNVDAGMYDSQGPDQIDFGDAPDPTYPTLLANNGARHVINPAAFLGGSIDADDDGQPNALANGDDKDGNDDDDGVNFTSALIPGSVASVIVTPISSGLLYGWIDFKHDGHFDVPADYVFSGQVLSPGPNVLGMNIPADAMPGDTYARFRFTVNTPVGPDGLAPDGEVEDYQVEIGGDDRYGYISDWVWHDTNHNGIQDTGEPGLDSVNVKLYDANGNLVAITLTNSTGYYIFGNLPPDDYFLVFTLKPGYIFSPQHQGMDPAIDSDPDPTGTTQVFTLAAGEHNQTMDAGMYQSEGPDQLDFGDAPDPTYPTLFTSNGARHIVQQGFFLGSGIDAEPNGQPTTLANGDNSNGSNDEDGVFMSPFIAPGQAVPITIVASAAGTVNAWLDFNANGSWADAGEHIIAAMPVNAGANSFTINVPAGAKVGPTYARFRFSSIRQLSYDGLAPDGEVEDYVLEIKDRQDGSIKIIKDAMPKDNTPFWMCAGIKNAFFNLLCFSLSDPSNNSFVFLNPGDVIDITESIIPGWTLEGINISGDADNGSTIDLTTGKVTLDFDTGENIVITFRNKKDGFVDELDFGDAPDPKYPTLLASNGARHVVQQGFFLGSGIDPEPNGQPTIPADGDNISGSNDEDGVQIPPIIAPGSAVSVKVIASAPGTLNAWLDFNINGSWADAGEQIISAQPVVAGVNSFTINVPAGAVVGQSYARFRLSSVRNISYNGLAPDGEVEDYAVAILKGGGGNLTIIKDATPKDDTPFWITVVYGVFGGAAPYRDPSSNSSSLVNGPTGIYHIGESVPADWTLTDIAVTGDTDNGSSIDVGNKKVDIDLDPGENITVIFKNKKGDNPPPPIKWPQIPKKKKGSDHPDCFWGWDEPSIYKRVVAADDWYSDDERPITDIHWWGSYQEWLDKIPPPAAPEQFHIGIWTDVPVAPNNPWSHPGTMIWKFVVDRSELNEQWVGCDFYPEKMQEAESCFKYDLLLPLASWFHPQSNTVYWISIAAIYQLMPNSNAWGWKTVEHYFQDDAVRMTMPSIPVLGDVFQTGQPIGDQWDLAFMLTTDQPSDHYDFGDAPDDPKSSIYPTLHANGGAYHTVDPGFFLGTNIDTELNGQPNANATGDNNAGSDDEDGVQFPSTMQVGQTVTIDVTVSAKGLLNTWIDYNQNQDWSDAGEQIFLDEPLNSGPNNLTFTIPASASEGFTFARFRLSRQPGISFMGWGREGEVEDYQIEIGGGKGTPLKWSQPPLFDSMSNDTTSFGGWNEGAIYKQSTLADDWFCHDPRPVTMVRWWGSYQEWDSLFAPPEAPPAFQIGVWTDVADDPAVGFSHPGEMIHEWIVPRNQVHETLDKSHYFPELMQKPLTCFRYTFNIAPTDWFYQQGDSTVYWLSIAAVYDEIPDKHFWGWLTREHYFNDDAVRILQPLEPHPGANYDNGAIVADFRDFSFELGTDEYESIYDFGDAPDLGYGTTLRRNGPQHLFDPGVRLGELIDPEPDGQPRADARGDDEDGGADEDGVIFLNDLIPGEMAGIKVTNSVHGFLNAWIDFYGDTNWNWPFDFVFTDVELSAGTHVMEFPVDEKAKIGNTIARFRFSTRPKVYFRGYAVDGEVEDYKIYIGITGVNTQSSGLPEKYNLYQNYPNPFNPQTIIPFDVKQTCRVELSIYDILGHEIQKLVNGYMPTGYHQVIFNASRLTSGVYFYRIKMNEYDQTIKMIYLR
jgi:PKD repeat protein